MGARRLAGLSGDWIGQLEMVRQNSRLIHNPLDRKIKAHGYLRRLCLICASQSDFQGTGGSEHMSQRAFRQFVQNALDVGWVAIIGDRFTIDVERCWWVLAVCGIGSGFVAEVHLRGGLWSGEHALPRGDESPVRRAMGVLICNTSAVV